VYCPWEDLHWADPSTLEVLALFLDQVPTTRLLVLLTFRPEFTSPWGNRSHLSQITLSRLGHSQVEAMVERVTGGKTLPPEVMQQIVAKTDGVPLFVEELTKTVVESGLLREEDGRYVGVHGGALAEQGRMEQGIEQMQQGLATLQATGAEGMRIIFLPMLAGVYAKVGRAEEGLSVVAEALAFVDKTGRRVTAAGLYVLKGWLLLACSGENQAEAEACFHKSIDIAHRQSAKSVELRAVMSLARLWQQQGKSTEAHQMLAEVYGWFTEGFDTKDLQETKALLAALDRQ
jgi:hypothetical protein